MVNDSLENKIAECRALHAQGYNCTQAVLMPFAAELGVDREVLASMGIGMGRGMGCGTEICGAATALVVAEGLLRGGAPERKMKSYAEVQSLLDAFRSRNGGCLRCADLKRMNPPRPCPVLMTDGVEILYSLCAAR